ncbi:MAG: TspO/MBR family protein [Janthinobacterium lividum]
MNYFFKRHRPEIIASLGFLTVAMALGCGAKSGDPLWYESLIKASFNPPSWIFGPVWGILYVMIGIAFGKVWKIRHQSPGLFVIFITQLLFNLLWPWLFFYFHRPDFAFYDICLLWFTLIFLMSRSYKTPARSVVIWLMLYLLWTSFALILNFTTAKLNHYF